MATLKELRDEAYVAFLHTHAPWTPGCAVQTKRAFEAGWTAALKAAAASLRKSHAELLAALARVEAI